MKTCPQCNSDNIRTFSQFNRNEDVWEWWNGCNKCEYETRDPDEEKLHPEYYNRNEFSPAKINSNDNQPNQ